MWQRETKVGRMKTYTRVVDQICCFYSFFMKIIRGYLLRDLVLMKNRYFILTSCLTLSGCIFFDETGSALESTVSAAYIYPSPSEIIMADRLYALEAEQMRLERERMSQESSYILSLQRERNQARREILKREHRAKILEAQVHAQVRLEKLKRDIDRLRRENDRAAIRYAREQQREQQREQLRQQRKEEQRRAEEARREVQAVQERHLETERLRREESARVEQARINSLATARAEEQRRAKEVNRNRLAAEQHKQMIEANERAAQLRNQAEEEKKRRKTLQELPFFEEETIPQT